MADCQVCISPMLLTVVSMAETGSGAGEISTATGLDELDIERHFVECCRPVTPVKDTMNASDDRLRQLQSRIELAISVSGLQGDGKNHLAGLSLALRAELELRRRLEDQAALERTSNLDSNALTIENLDRLVESYAAEVKATTGNCLMCGHPRNQEGSQNANASPN
jgi:hypothetical protein